MSTIGEHREANIHINDGSTQKEFVNLRTTRDKTLSMPSLMLPALQVNIRAGKLPRNDRSNQPALTIPLNIFSDNPYAIDPINW